MLVAFPLGGNDQGQSFELAEPLPLSIEEDQEVDYEHLPEPGALARHLQHFGESLCRMTLAHRSYCTSNQRRGGDACVALEWSGGSALYINLTSKGDATVPLVRPSI